MVKKRFNFLIEESVLEELRLSISTSVSEFLRGCVEEQIESNKEGGVERLMEKKKIKLLEVESIEREINSRNNLIKNKDILKEEYEERLNKARSIAINYNPPNEEAFKRIARMNKVDYIDLLVDIPENLKKKMVKFDPYIQKL